mgnify:CR=1
NSMEDNKNKNLKEDSQFIVNQNYRFKLKSNLYCKIIATEEETTTDGKQDGVRITYNIQVYSYVFNINDIIKFLDEC